MARGYPRVILLAGLVALLVNIGLNILLIPRMGVSGAALASAVSYTLNALVVLTAFLRISGLRAAVVLVPRGSDFRLLRDSLRMAIRRGREGKR
jgi:Na+-driven multidrug efflux pump